MSLRLRLPFAADLRRAAPLALGLWALWAAPRPALAGETWDRVSDKGGVIVERRSVPGSSWKEHRATAHSDLPPERIYAAAHHSRRDDPKAQRYVKVYNVLRESDRERLVYEQVRAPLVSDRDYTVLISWQGDAQRRVYEVRFELRNQDGPPPSPGFVRMEALRGRWRIEADPAGGSRIEYVVLSDPAGSLPAWVARGAQVDSTRDQVLDTLAYAEAHPNLK